MVTYKKNKYLLIISLILVTIGNLLTGETTGFLKFLGIGINAGLVGILVGMANK